MIQLDEPHDALRQLGEQRPSLAGPAAVLQEVLPVLFADVPAADFQLGDAAAREKLAADVPLLRGESLQIAATAFQRRWSAVCTAVQRHQGTTDAGRLSAALQKGDLSSDELVRQVLAGQRSAIAQRARSLGLNVALTTSVLRLVLFPILAQLSSALAPHLARHRWRRGFCGVCGSWPLLAERRGLEQLCFLRCGLCAADWEFPRLCCPFCELRDHHQLGYFEIEDQCEKQLATTCDRCRGFLKTVFTLAALDPPQLLIADLATIHLELAAGQRGYAVPPAEPV